MKYLKKVDQYFKLLEQDNAISPPEPGPGQTPDQPAEMPEPGEGDTVPSEEPLPESNVLLVRLLLKALVMDIDPEDVRAIQGMGDVNENNASEILDKLITMMKNYSADIDIET